ncbi:single-stranded DNA-binding protein [Acetobacter conturbans]|uniref:Single-stranded DNA-binding protein n=1 Tax=Acetobacter conturbans TaxID=1737472 RepID=A0ABX0JWF9_9PROT|nr:single-stranded DNA-binding protein [Acetobacter conturbans]NHN87826.1 single-stranded DNA-binding protein [Acetobacter conturbans]
MAGSVNKVILVGNLGRDPEIRTSQSGQKIASLSVATSDTWNDRTSGERRERTEWHRVVVFNDRIADVAERFLRKGRKVYVEGTLQTRKWTDQSGQEKYTTEIVLDRFRGELVLLDGRGSGEGEEGGGGSSGYGGAESDGGFGGGGGTPRRIGGASGAGGAGGARKSAPASPGGWDAPSGDLDDEIPF